ncbi:MAG: hypothetical protein RIM84_22325 [Alphaproteobacteria bacterium]
MVRTLLTTALGLGMLSLVSPAAAQSICGERGDFIKHLEKRHQEQPTSMGLASNGKMIEVLTSDNGTWTIIVTTADGTSCVVAAGEAWQTMMPQVAMKPAA